jgi:hypothetical protein
LNQLQDLGLDGTMVTDAGVRHLNDALPTCCIHATTGVNE